MKRMLLRSLPFVFLLVSVPASAQIPKAWTEAIEPVRIVGNIYYVGTADLGAYLLVGKEGAILLDAPMDENVPLLLRNIRKVGVKPNRVKVLLNSHAHMDHGGGLAAIRKATGARLHLSAQDAMLAARGGRDDFAFGDSLPYPPVTADAVVRDGQTIRLGELAMTAMITPGHTRGCTTWRTTATEGGKTLDVVFLCSVTAPGYKLTANEKYPGIVADYRATFAALAKLKPDVFLANHGDFFALTHKRGLLRAGAPNPFVDREEFDRYLAAAQSGFEKELSKQEKAAQ